MSPAESGPNLFHQPFAYQHVERADDRRRQVVEVVRHTAGEGTHRLEFLTLTECLLRFLKLRLIAQPLRHVRDELVSPNRLASVIPERAKLILVIGPGTIGIAEVLDERDLLA
jgi:hypothetical protein